MIVSSFKGAARQAEGVVFPDYDNHLYFVRVSVSDESKEIFQQFNLYTCQYLSQDLETGCLKLAIVKFLSAGYNSTRPTQVVRRGKLDPRSDSPARLSDCPANLIISACFAMYFLYLYLHIFI